MKVPDSLQKIGSNVFYGCSKLVPSDIDVSDLDNDATSEVVDYLRSVQSASQPPSAPPTLDASTVEKQQREALARSLLLPSAPSLVVPLLYSLFRDCNYFN
ncbi:hypothetical protein TrLO_g1512 [Triparma laevis f. longispina]|uniref:Uncharacterized protein n=1 Tax=Triparma laevis f. longispina TaxID=1714387 RepID=A0A9W7ED91_9STRA|nr:hypothetical protein TrLO_g1512 [Triparma laevis f. longispina]